MAPNMIGRYLHLQDPERDCLVENEINTKVFRLHDLTPEEEQEANRVIHEAAFILNRHLPRPDRLDPLYRKYYKVKNSDTTYAFGTQSPFCIDQEPSCLSPFWHLSIRYFIQ